MALDFDALSKLKEQIMQENNRNPKMYHIVNITRSATDVDDDWLSQPKWKSPACDGYWIETKDGFSTLNVSAILSFKDVESLVNELSKYFDEDLRKDLKMPFDQIDNAEDFVYSLPDYVLEQFRITPFREYERNVYPEAVFLTREAANDFLRSLDTNEYLQNNLYVKELSSLEKSPELKLMIDVIRNVDIKALKKAMPKEEQR